MVKLGKSELMEINGGIGIELLAILLLAVVGFQGCCTGIGQGYKEKDQEFKLDEQNSESKD